MLPRFDGSALPNDTSSHDNYASAVLPGITGSSLSATILHDHSVILLPRLAGSQLSAAIPTK